MQNTDIIETSIVQSISLFFYGSRYEINSLYEKLSQSFQIGILPTSGNYIMYKPSITIEKNNGEYTLMAEIEVKNIESAEIKFKNGLTQSLFPKYEIVLNNEKFGNTNEYLQVKPGDNFIRISALKI